MDEGTLQVLGSDDLFPFAHQVNIMARVAIIGAGVAGLTAALYATTAGHQVVVLDRTARLGGRATSEHVGSVPFGFGPHLLVNNGPLAKVVKKISRLKMALAPLRTDRLHVQGHGTIRPRGDVKTAAQNRALLRGQDPSSPLVQAVDLLAGMGQIHGHQPRVSALLKHRLMVVGEGWAGLIGRMAAALDEVGVLIEPNSDVTSIDGRDVVLADGRRFSSDVVILACGWRRARSILQPLMGEACPNLVPMKASTIDVHVSSQPLADRHGVIDPERHGLLLSLSNIQPKMAVSGSLLSSVVFSLEGESTADRSNRLFEFMDVHAPGWREHTVEQRLQTSITVQTEGDKPSFDALRDQGVLLAGEWVDSDHLLSDAAAHTGRLAGSNILKALR